MMIMKKQNMVLMLKILEWILVGFIVSSVGFWLNTTGVFALFWSCMWIASFFLFYVNAKTISKYDKKVKP